MEKNDIIKKVFKKMKDSGWDLDDNTYEDFIFYYNAAIEHFYNILHEDEIVDEGHIGFIADFLWNLNEVLHLPKDERFEVKQ